MLRSFSRKFSRKDDMDVRKNNDPEYLTDSGDTSSSSGSREGETLDSHFSRNGPFSPASCSLSHSGISVVSDISDCPTNESMTIMKANERICSDFLRQVAECESHYLKVAEEIKDVFPAKSKEMHDRLRLLRQDKAFLLDKKNFLEKIEKPELKWVNHGTVEYMFQDESIGSKELRINIEEFQKIGQYFKNKGVKKGHMMLDIKSSVIKTDNSTLAVTPSEGKKGVLKWKEGNDNMLVKSTTLIACASATRIHLPKKNIEVILYEKRKLLSPLEIGRAKIELNDLNEKCHIRCTAAILNKQRGAECGTGATVTISVSIRTPIANPEGERRSYEDKELQIIWPQTNNDN